MNNTSTQNLEALKSDFETELMRMEAAGQDLLQNHPRYATQAQEMINIARKKLVECNENMFSMALGANFQAGKSTTVNALSDGHVICPSGNGGGGIRTSSCAVRVNYGLSGGNPPSIAWKSKESLSRDLEYWTGGVLSLEQDKQQFRASLEELALNMGEQLKTNETTVIDRMHQVLLYMSYYDHPQVTQWLSQNTFSNEEVLAFLAFPNDNRQRWLRVHNQIKRLTEPTTKQLRDIVRNEFYPTNAMYLFIGIVHFATPSEYLKAMGITVIDTPGLNMSDNDTRVAASCMSDATSIFYFFDGESELSEADLKALQLIDSLGFKDKVFFGINFRSPVDDRAFIRETILVQLEDLGYNAPHQKHLILFNAFLAQRARQGHLILNNQLTRNDEDKIMQEAENIHSNAKTVEQAWIDTTANVLNRVGVMSEQNFKAMGLCDRSITLAYQASRWEQAMNFILDYVLENRSRLLLVERVAKPIEAQLNTIEQVLRSDEANAAQTADNLRDNYRRAIQSYRDFQRECNEKLNDRIKDDWDRIIAEDYYKNVYEKCPASTAADAVDELQKQQTFLNNMGFLATGALNNIRGFFNASKVGSSLERECAAIMKKSLENTVTPLAIAWSSQFENGTIYQNTIRTSVDNLHRDISDIWKRRGLESDEILKNLFYQLQTKLPSGNFSTDSEDIVLPDETLTEILGQNIKIGGAATDTLKGMIGGILGASGVAYVYLFVLPLDFVVPFAGQIIAVIMLAITALISRFSGSERRLRDKRQLQQGLEEALNERFFNPQKREEIIRNLMVGGTDKPDESSGELKSPGTQIYRRFYRAAFEEAIKSCGELLEAQAQQAEADAKRGDAARKSIAAEAKQIRENIIVTLQNGMNSLQNKVEALFPSRTA